MRERGLDPSQYYLQGKPIATRPYTPEELKEMVSKVVREEQLTLFKDGEIKPLQGCKCPPAKSSGNKTRLGVSRDNPADWKATRDLWDRTGYGEILSDMNRVAIAQELTPVVDDAWVRYFPEDAGLMGELIPMHHIRALP